MAKVTMYVLKGCPYCKQALGWMDELFQRHPELRRVELEVVDEWEQPVRAEEMDYYYVPTYYVGDEKAHEGIASRRIIERVFRQALDR